MIISTEEQILPSCWCHTNRQWVYGHLSNASPSSPVHRPADRDVRVNQPFFSCVVCSQPGAQDHHQRPGVLLLGHLHSILLEGTQDPGLPLLLPRIGVGNKNTHTCRHTKISETHWAIDRLGEFTAFLKKKGPTFDSSWRSVPPRTFSRSDPAPTWMCDTHARPVNPHTCYSQTSVDKTRPINPKTLSKHQTLNRGPPSCPAGWHGRHNELSLAIHLHGRCSIKETLCYFLTQNHKSKNRYFRHLCFMACHEKDEKLLTSVPPVEYFFTPVDWRSEEDGASRFTRLKTGKRIVTLWLCYLFCSLSKQDLACMSFSTWNWMPKTFSKHPPNYFIVAMLLPDSIVQKGLDNRVYLM